MTLEQFFQENPRCALGFSGGVDSAYLLYAGVKAGADIRPYFIKTAFQPVFELADAQKLAAGLGVEVTVLELDALAQVWPRLDENTRWLLEARYILDYSDGELARELGVKPDSVRMALTRARRKARRLMESQHNEQNV